MLGPGIITAGTPFVFGYASHTRSRGQDPGWARAALLVILLQAAVVVAQIAINI